MDKTKVNNGLVSVIIPYYKVPREYVYQCLDSVLKQTYPFLEIIIIDDGNPENDALWLDEVAAGDKRIIIIHQKNQGVSVARNVGVEEAKGKWIYFCDPDDWMADTEIEKLVALANENDADIVKCGYKKVHDLKNSIVKGQEYIVDTFIEQEIDELLKFLLLPYKELKCKGILPMKQHIPLVVVWATVYKKDVIKNIRFEVGLHPMEDEIFNIYAFDAATRVTLTTEILHYYRYSENVGVTRTYNPNYVDNRIRGRGCMNTFIKDRKKEYLLDKNFEKIIEIRDIYDIAMHSFFHKKNPSSYKEKKQAFLKYLDENARYISNSKIFDFCTIKQQVFFVLVKYKWCKLIELLLK